MKKTLIALSLAAMTLPALAQQKAPEPDFTITGNFGITTDYRFRGVSQSNKDPAVQGGIDFAHKSGFYLGNWNSSVSEWASAFGSGIEMDLYGGYKTEIAGVAVDAGLIYYYYPGAQQSATSTFNPFNTRELYLGFGYGPISLKMSRTMSDRYFALGKGNDTSLTRDASGTMYYDVTYTKEIMDKTTLKLHFGSLDLANQTPGTSSIRDYSVGLAYDVSGWILGATYVKTSGLSNAAKSWFTSTDGRGTKLYDSQFLVSVTKTF